MENGNKRSIYTFFFRIQLHQVIKMADTRRRELPILCRCFLCGCCGCGGGTENEVGVLVLCCHLYCVYMC